MSNLILLSLLISGTGAVPLIRPPHTTTAHISYMQEALFQLFQHFIPFFFAFPSFFLPILFPFIGTISYTLSASFYALCNHDTSE